MMTFLQPKRLRLLLYGANLLLSFGQYRGQAAVPVPQHVFQPPRPKWLKEIDYLQEDGPGSFIVVKPADRDPKFRGYHREIRYYRNRHDLAAERPCKILRDSPSGSREEEIDNIGTDQYSREFYADGSVSSCLHWQGKNGVFGKWLDGYSVSPVKRTVTRFADGRGDLTVWNNAVRDEGTFTRSWYVNGDVYLEQWVTRSRPTETILRGPHDDNLSIKTDEETLTLVSLHEEWTKRRGQGPYAQIMGAFDMTTRKEIPSDVTRDPVKLRIRQAWPLVVHSGSPVATGHHFLRSRPGQPSVLSADRRELLAQLAKDYLARRAGFLAVYGKRVSQAGQSWRILGLENVLEGMP